MLVRVWVTDTLLVGVYIGTNCMNSEFVNMDQNWYVFRLGTFNLIIPPFGIYLTHVLKYVKMMHIE